MEKNYINTEQDRRLSELDKKMEVVFSHIAATNGELGKIKVDVCWLKKFFWVVTAASISGLVAAILNLIIQVK